MDLERSHVSRRSFLSRSLAAGAALSVGSMLPRIPRAFAGPGSGLPSALVGSAQLDLTLLPSSQRLYADMKTMCDFGPRFTGSSMHNDFIAWLDQEFRRAGCDILPYDTYDCFLWEARDWSLDILDGTFAGPVPVAAYYVRGGETPEGGVTGKLIYGGTAPSLNLSGDATDVIDIKAAFERYQRDLGDWMTATVSRLGAQAEGAILVIDVNLPPPINEGVIGEGVFTVEYMQWPGGAWQHRQYKRLWLATLGAVGAQTGGAAGAVYVLDASFDALHWQYLPFNGAHGNLPALWVDRDAGAMLRKAATTQPTVRLTMTADITNTTSPSFVAVLPGDGSTDEVMVGNTHTDGTNFVEENGTVGLLAMARYFQARKLQGKSLRRSLVFSCVTGHWSSGFPQTAGFIESHPELIQRTAAAVTVEHFGCTEWYDDERGYYATGVPELCLIPHAESGIAAPVLDSVMRHNLLHHGVSRGVEYLGIGADFEQHGVPAASFVAGPNYLTPTGHITQFDGCLDQLDAELASRQLAWLADLFTRLDGISAEQLAAGDTAVIKRVRS